MPDILMNICGGVLCLTVWFLVVYLIALPVIEPFMEYRYFKRIEQQEANKAADAVKEPVNA